MDFDLNVDKVEDELHKLVEYVMEGGDTSTEAFEADVTDVIHKMLPEGYSTIKPFIPAAVKAFAAEASFGIGALFDIVVTIIEDEKLQGHGKTLRRFNAKNRHDQFTAYIDAGFSTDQAMQLLLAGMNKPDPMIAAVRSGAAQAAARASRD